MWCLQAGSCTNDKAVGLGPYTKKVRRVITLSRRKGCHGRLERKVEKVRGTFLLWEYGNTSPTILRPKPIDPLHITKSGLKFP